MTQTKCLIRSMNIELTTKCPLRCPQCYCSLEGGKNIDVEVAKYWIDEGKKNGLKELMLSGGETMCYPELMALVKKGSELGIDVNVAFSGVGFTQQIYNSLLENGVGHIFISLNGSTEEINSYSRDGYKYAIAALELLKQNEYNNTIINWVMHSNNADDFGNLVDLAERYNVSLIAILGVKPDSKNDLKTYPSLEQMKKVRDIIRKHKGHTKIVVESCFSPMRALVGDTKLFGNLNVGTQKGCTAGINEISINVDGMLSPCRHLDYFEKFGSLQEYFDKSEIQKKLCETDNEKHKPCSECRFSDNCRPCMAINAKLNNEIYFGFEACPVFEEKQR